jgi:hypothetical protein
MITMSVNEFLAAARPSLELLSFLSAPAVAVAAFIGLKQLRISKQTSQLAATRDAYRLAADQCTFYVDRVIPALNRLDAAIATKKVTYFRDSVVTIEEQMIRVTPPKDSKAINAVIDVASEQMEALNLLSSFALFFVSRVADESVAFSAVGQTYCRSVRDLLPILAPLSRASNGYAGIVRLFMLWQSRLERQELEAAKTVLEKKLAETSNSRITPLGADD